MLNKYGISSVTISSWIIQTINTAYSGVNLKVTDHSTRAIAPSWAFQKGASTKSILYATDWLSETRFVKFYLRDLDSAKLLQKYTVHVIKLYKKENWYDGYMRLPSKTCTSLTSTGCTKAFNNGHTSTPDNKVQKGPQNII